MTFQFNRKKHEVLYTTERHSKSIISYYSKGKMIELYSNRGYEVIGEISNCAKIYSGQDEIITDTGKSIPIFPRGSYKKPIEWVAGYAAIEENTYVAVIKSMIPRLF